SGGGFAQDGHFHPMQPNRAGESYPIHGDGWLQAWQLARPTPGTMVMTLESHRFAGNPYDYEAVQTFRLVEGGLDQELQVRHL
ncbi:aldose epimerase family protein, partial [Priestia megaterium]|uniref:aldose epimerase family protein n=1 Tax=Priestia megaterium TaxID=1404 RepID=UPI0035B57E56